jgi:hypothetical protein
MRSSQTTLQSSALWTDISSTKPDPYFVCSSNISKIKMDPIPWSNASYLVTQLGNGYILNYTDNDSNYYYSTFNAIPTIPSSLQPTIDNIRFQSSIIYLDTSGSTSSDDSSDDYKVECRYYINNYNYNIGYPSTFTSGGITLKQPILNSDFRFIVIVRYKDDNMPAGYFYVDVSKTGAVTLST